MASAICGIRRHVTDVTKKIYDGDQLMYKSILTADEYLEEMLEALYDKHVSGVKGLRLRMAMDHFLGGRYLATVSHGNGCRVTYKLHY